MKTRCKFKVISRTETEWGWDLKAQAVCGDEGEDAKFYAATPHGTFEVSVVRNDAINAFKPGSTFYMDLTPIAAEETETGSSD